MHNFVHIQIMVKNLDEMISFYDQIFSWTFTKDDDLFATFQVKIEGQYMSGSLEVSKLSEGNNSIIPVIHVLNIDKTIDKVLSLGGKVILPKQATEHFPGYHTIFADPEGNYIALWSEDE